MSAQTHKEFCNLVSGTSGGCGLSPKIHLFHNSICQLLYQRTKKHHTAAELKIQNTHTEAPNWGEHGRKKLQYINK